MGGNGQNAAFPYRYFRARLELTQNASESWRSVRARGLSALFVGVTIAVATCIRTLQASKDKKMYASLVLTEMATAIHQSYQ